MHISTLPVDILCSLQAIWSEGPVVVTDADIVLMVTLMSQVVNEKTIRRRCQRVMFVLRQLNGKLKDFCARYSERQDS